MNLTFAVHLRHRFDVIVLSSFVLILVIIEDIEWLDTVYLLCGWRIGVALLWRGCVWKHLPIPLALILFSLV